MTRLTLTAMLVAACAPGTEKAPPQTTSPSETSTNPSTPTTTTDSGTPSPTTTDTATPTTAPILLQVEATPPNPLARLVTLTNAGAADTTATVVYGPDATLSRATPAVVVPAGGTVQVPVLGLYPGVWSLAVEAEGVVGPAVDLATELAPRPLPTTESIADPSTFDEQEAICVALESPPTYLCTDREGRPTLAAPLPGNAMFVRALSDGTFVGHPDGPPYLTHFDALGHELDRITLDALTGTTFRHDWIDEHEVIELVDGPWAGAWAVLTASEERVGNRWVIGAGLIVFEPTTRAVLWDWSSHGASGDDAPIDPLLAYERTGLFDYGDDWLHANAVVHRIADDGSDTFWFSLRHQDWVVAIEAPSGAVRWRLGYQGDFELVDDLDAATPAVLPDDLWMFHQHAPEPRALGNGRTELLLFDNGNARPDDQGRPDERNAYSRALRLVIDETTMRAAIDWSFGAPEPSPDHFFSPAAGDADRLHDGSGSIYVKALGDAQIVDVTDDGTVRWRQTYTTEGELYRAEVYPSLYATGWEATTGW